MSEPAEAYQSLCHITNLVLSNIRIYKARVCQGVGLHVSGEELALVVKSEYTGVHPEHVTNLASVHEAREYINSAFRFALEEIVMRWQQQIANANPTEEVVTKYKSVIDVKILKEFALTNEIRGNEKRIAELEDAYSKLLHRLKFREDAYAVKNINFEKEVSVLKEHLHRAYRDKGWQAQADVNLDNFGVQQETILEDFASAVPSPEVTQLKKQIKMQDEQLTKATARLKELEMETLNRGKELTVARDKLKKENEYSQGLKIELTALSNANEVMTRQMADKDDELQELRGLVKTYAEAAPPQQVVDPVPFVSPFVELPESLDIASLSTSSMLTKKGEKKSPVEGAARRKSSQVPPASPRNRRTSIASPKAGGAKKMKASAMAALVTVRKSIVANDETTSSPTGFAGVEKDEDDESTSPPPLNLMGSEEPLVSLVTLMSTNDPPASPRPKKKGNTKKGFKAIKTEGGQWTVEVKDQAEPIPVPTSHVPGVDAEAQTTESGSLVVAPPFVYTDEQEVQTDISGISPAEDKAAADKAAADEAAAAAVKAADDKAEAEKKAAAEKAEAEKKAAAEKAEADKVTAAKVLTDMKVALTDLKAKSKESFSQTVTDAVAVDVSDVMSKYGVCLTRPRAMEILADTQRMNPAEDIGASQEEFGAAIMLLQAQIEVLLEDHESANARRESWWEEEMTTVKGLVTKGESAQLELAGKLKGTESDRDRELERAKTAEGKIAWMEKVERAAEALRSNVKAETVTREEMEAQEEEFCESLRRAEVEDMVRVIAAIPEPVGPEPEVAHLSVTPVQFLQLQSTLSESHMVTIQLLRKIRVLEQAFVTHKEKIHVLETRGGLVEYKRRLHLKQDKKLDESLVSLQTQHAQNLATLQHKYDVVHNKYVIQQHNFSVTNEDLHARICQLKGVSKAKDEASRLMEEAYKNLMTDHGKLRSDYDALFESFMKHEDTMLEIESEGLQAPEIRMDGVLVVDPQRQPFFWEGGGGGATVGGNLTQEEQENCRLMQRMLDRSMVDTTTRPPSGFEVVTDVVAFTLRASRDVFHFYGGLHKILTKIVNIEEYDVEGTSPRTDLAYQLQQTRDKELHKNTEDIQSSIKVWDTLQLLSQVETSSHDMLLRLRRQIRQLTANATDISLGDDNLLKGDEKNRADVTPIGTFVAQVSTSLAKAKAQRDRTPRASIVDFPAAPVVPTPGTAPLLSRRQTFSDMSSIRKDMTGQARLRSEMDGPFPILPQLNLVTPKSKPLQRKASIAPSREHVFTPPVLGQTIGRRVQIQQVNTPPLSETPSPTAPEVAKQHPPVVDDGDDSIAFGNMNRILSNYNRMKKTIVKEKQ